MNLTEFLNTVKNSHYPEIDLFFDIETYQYNEKAGYDHPSQFKNQVFSLAVSWWYHNQIHIAHYPTFRQFFDEIEGSNPFVSLKINLIAHNGNKYDNNYMLTNILHDYPDIKRYPMYQSQATNHDNEETFKTLHKHKGDQIILEKRVKSKSSVELKFTLGTCTYQTLDTYPKFNLSLGTIGKKLYRLKLVGKDELKTDFNYTKYNRQDDMEYVESILYAIRIFSQLSTDENIYIRNDVILLAKAWKYFELLNPKFDRKKITFSQNVMEEYKINPLAVFQLTGKVASFNVNYSDYTFRNENYSDFMKHFYKGGLNIYNDQYVGEIINHEIYSYDLNSSYPNIMYNNMVPTFLINVIPNSTTIKIDYDEKYFSLYEITVETFNELLSDIQSTMIKKVLTKYYSNFYENVYINTNTLRLMNAFNRHKINYLDTISVQTFECLYFGGRDVISDNYYIKTQGKNKHVIEYNSPNDIKITNEINQNHFSKEEVDNSKVTLNGIYGLPALRPYYNYFKWNNQLEMYDSYPNGFKNSERNQIFSIFVTSQAFLNLLRPLMTLTPDEIDKYWYYADTDSLYIDARVDDKIDKTLFNNYNLGYWKKEHHITKFYMMNHKKYAFEDLDNPLAIKDSDGNILYYTPINIRSGGVSISAFNRKDISFNKFIIEQFSPGISVKGNKSVLTNMGTIAIYNSDIKLDLGKPYLTKMNKGVKRVLQTIANNAKDDIIDTTGDALYIETPWGILSVNEVIGTGNEKKVGGEIKELIELNQFIKGRLLGNGE